MPHVKTLLIDNYDSYTYNLFQLIATVNQGEPTVVRNDQLDYGQLKADLAAGCYDNIIISPGPGTPLQAKDIGVCLPLLRDASVPVLGVCLGHQALAVAWGGKVRHSPEPVHGRLSDIRHSGHSLFHGIPSGRGNGFSVVRYHSLVVDLSSLPCCLEAIAWTDGASHALLPPTAKGTSFVQAATYGRSSSEEVPVLMGLAHRERPLFGVQFHPESIASTYGQAILQNFLNITCATQGLQLPPSLSNLKRPPGRALPARKLEAPRGTPATAPLKVCWRKLAGALSSVGGSDGLFHGLFGRSSSSATNTFWLDSSATDRGQFSFMGGRGGQLWRRITYRVPDLSPSTPTGQPAELTGATSPTQTTSAHPAALSATTLSCPPHLSPTEGPLSGKGTVGVVTVEDVEGRTEVLRMGLLEWLDEQLERYRTLLEPGAILPFPFWGGFVGYLGLIAVDHSSGDVYAVSMCQRDSANDSQQARNWLHTIAGQVIALSERHMARGMDPTLLVLNHSRMADSTLASSSNYISTRDCEDGTSAPCSSSQRLNGCHEPVCTRYSCEALDEARIVANGSCRAEGRSVSMAQGSHAPQMNGKMHRHEGSAQHAHGCACSRYAASAHSPAVQHPDCLAQLPAFRLRRPRQRYLCDVGACHQLLRDGETYEVCLTTALVREGTVDALALYHTLRAINPAPYAAWLCFGRDDLQICCSSPERFLRCGLDGVLEARPIKGTAATHPDLARNQAAAEALACSEKDHAENLMIVDLLRNDLGRVCEVCFAWGPEFFKVGSVHVPALMEVESYASVHQLVSTVRGTRRADARLSDCLRATFPGGSMTGAPKLRTMDIIDRLEGSARGVYSGSIGYIGLNGAFDLNIVIRTAVVHAGEVTIGAGGAIVVQSDAEGEYDEMRLKAQALLRAVGLCDAAATSRPACPAAVIDNVAYVRGDSYAGSRQST